MAYIYLDNITATKPHKEVVDAITEYLTDKYALATSQFSHSMGLENKDGYDNARHTIADSIGANDENILFTSGSTESNNLAVKGFARANKKKGNHLITTAVSDRSVLNSMKTLQKEGFEVTILPVDANGRVNLNDLSAAIKDSTIFFSFELANHEVGTIENYKEIVELCKKKGIVVHMDASLGYLHLPIDVKTLPLDLITLTAKRIHGPIGIGALYIRPNIKITKLMDGGFNEMNLRAGSEPVALAVGFAKAVELFDRENDVVHTGNLKRKLLQLLRERIAEISVNGDPDNAMSNVLNVTFHKVEGESTALYFDMEGIEVITGSACFSQSLEPSYVLMAMYNDHERAHGSITFSFSRYNTEDEIVKTADAAKRIVDKLLEISPLK
ncbi:MAG: aminotransferase class V-fold PLP-dependent enzyme [Proteobacteria bacterium]|nr:aminotransferase class V-fold PLP-dependent enzyme [Pseudomonadota bacterium]